MRGKPPLHPSAQTCRAGGDAGRTAGRGSLGCRVGAGPAERGAGRGWARAPGLPVRCRFTPSPSAVVPARGKLSAREPRTAGEDSALPTPQQSRPLLPQPLPGGGGTPVLPQDSPAAPSSLQTLLHPRGLPGQLQALTCLRSPKPPLSTPRPRSPPQLSPLLPPPSLHWAGALGTPGSHLQGSAPEVSHGRPPHSFLGDAPLAPPSPPPASSARPQPRASGRPELSGWDGPRVSSKTTPAVCS